jgi:hypothetical protein
LVGWSWAAQSWPAKQYIIASLAVSISPLIPKKKKEPINTERTREEKKIPTRVGTTVCHVDQSEWREAVNKLFFASGLRKKGQE